MGAVAMGGPAAFSWNSELPSGRNPFWIKDAALSGLGLRPGDVVSVDTRAEPRDGDLVVADVGIDGDSQRLARRYFSSGASVRLESADDASGTLELPADQVMVMGVINGRVRFEADAAIEEPL
jgi:SOS-response transcriptional repressor LexA